jgi:hypothetical protein
VSGTRRVNVGTLVERVLGSWFDDTLINGTGGDREPVAPPVLLTVAR